MSRVQRALWLFGGLTALALLFAGQLFFLYRNEAVPVPFVPILVMQIGHWYCWAVAGPVAWSLAARWPLHTGRRRRNFWRHAAAAVAIAFAVVAVFAAQFQVLTWMPWTAGWMPVRDSSIATTATFIFSAYFHIELLVYAGVVATAHATLSNRQLVARERESLLLSSQLANARLQVLTAQLQPHFLFNTLHTVGSLILQRKNDEAMRILAELGDLLRITLTRQSSATIPLRQELDHLERYLRIEETRFRDRLSVRWEIDPMALEWPVPPLILQPLVENALKHGVAARIDAGTLEVRATPEDGVLRIAIYNDGPLLPDTWSGQSSFGFGLRNVGERLAMIGKGCTVTVENVGRVGVRASMELTRG
jgi:two-component system, LytTR family, sensor kinase